MLFQKDLGAVLRLLCSQTGCLLSYFERVSQLAAAFFPPVFTPRVECWGAEKMSCFFEKIWAQFLCSQSGCLRWLTRVFPAVGSRPARACTAEAPREQWRHDKCLRTRFTAGVCVPVMFCFSWVGDGVILGKNGSPFAENRLRVGSAFTSALPWGPGGGIWAKKTFMETQRKNPA